MDKIKILELQIKIIIEELKSANPDVIKSVCDHIDEKSGMICTGGRCNKCNEIV